MATTEFKWGSAEWKTHLRRSLAQRKRHGEKITDIEGLIQYIESKGPGKGTVSKNGKARKEKVVKHNDSKQVNRKKEAARRPKKGANSTTAKGVPVQKGRGARRQGQKQPEQKGVTVIKVGQHGFL